MEDQLKSGKFTLVDDDGKEVEYTTLFTFYSEVFEKNYVVYTDNGVDEDGNRNVFASSYDPADDSKGLMVVENDEEWENITALLNEIMSEDVVA